MLTVILVLWIPFGLLNLYIMKKADQAVKHNSPPFGFYWIKNEEVFGAVASIAGGFACLPFTLWAAYEWYRLS